jgi:uncharacterized membrane protein
MPLPLTLRLVNLLVVLMSIKQLLNKRKESFLNYLILLTICILALVSANHVSSV